MASNSTQSFDFIIVGGGLAGSTLSYCLMNNGKSVLLIDRNQPATSSRIAAGIIHPVTGRRIVKTWMADELIPFAKNFYKVLEKKMNVKLFHEMPIIELFTSVKHRNDWLARSAENDFEKYFSHEINPGEFARYFNCDFGGIALKETGNLDTVSYLKVLHEIMYQKGGLCISGFSFDELQLESSYVRWKNFTAGQIIFCEGYEAIRNPWFNCVPFLPAKGELLLIHCPELPEKYILNQSMFLLPASNHLFKAGSTYEWNFNNENPTELAAQRIASFLKSFLKVPFSVYEHVAAVRPAIKDRRPVAGIHPVHRQVGIFNGLGSKGVLLAPWFASRFAGYLCGKNNLDPETDLSRFTIA